MENKLKYGFLLKHHNLEDSCPSQDCSNIDYEAFRWVLDPIENELNFLPNILYDQKRGRPIRVLPGDESRLCKRCGISLFTTSKDALDTFSQFEERIQILLGFTHLAKGQIGKDDGLSSTANKDNHLTFYEFENAELFKKFIILEKLS